MLNSKALEAARNVYNASLGGEGAFGATERIVAAYLTASMPEDVTPCGLQCRYIGPGNGDFRYSRDWVEVDPNDPRRADYEYREVYDATALSTLSTKVEELTNALAVQREAKEHARRECDRAEASLAERDRIIAEKDKGLDELLAAYVEDHPFADDDDDPDCPLVARRARAARERAS